MSFDTLWTPTLSYFYVEQLFSEILKAKSCFYMLSDIEYLNVTFLFFMSKVNVKHFEKNLGVSQWYCWAHGVRWGCSLLFRRGYLTHYSHTKAHIFFQEKPGISLKKRVVNDIVGPRFVLGSLSSPTVTVSLECLHPVHTRCFLVHL